MKSNKKTYTACIVKEMLLVQHRQTTRLTSDSQIEALPHIAAMAKGVVWSLSTAFTWQLAALISICVHNCIFSASLCRAAKMPTLIFPTYLHLTRSLLRAVRLWVHIKTAHNKTAIEGGASANRMQRHAGLDYQCSFIDNDKK